MDSIIKLMLSALPKKALVNWAFNWLADQAKKTKTDWDDVAVEELRAAVIRFIDKTDK